MTRAQILIFSKIQGLTFRYGVNSDGYPDRILPILKRYKGDVTLLDNEFSMEVPGNPSYYYELNCDNGIVTCWGTQTYWRNAPKDWRERGWNCWQNDKGDYGYSNFRKGKIEFNTRVSQTPIKIKLYPNAQYSPKDILSLKKETWISWDLKQLLKRRNTTPDILYTYIYAERDIHRKMYVIPYNDIPLYINEEGTEILKWRLSINV